MIPYHVVWKFYGRQPGGRELAEEASQYRPHVFEIFDEIEKRIDWPCNSCRKILKSAIEACIFSHFDTLAEKIPEKDIVWFEVVWDEEPKLMYYVFRTNYLGPNSKMQYNEKHCYIQTAPGRTNLHHELITHGWLGRIGDWNTSAHGEYEDLDEAMCKIKQMTGGKYREDTEAYRHEYDPYGLFGLVFSCVPIQAITDTNDIEQL